MKYVKTVRTEGFVCPAPKISTRAAAGAAVGAVVGGVCAGKAGAIVGGLVGYAIGKSMDPMEMILPLYHK